MNRLKVFHPFLFAVFPILSLYANNKDLVHPSYAVWPLIFSLSLSLALFLFIEHFLKNVQRAAILTSVFLVSFFSFGHFLELPPLSLIKLPNENLNYYILLFFWVIFLATISFFVLSSKRNFEKLTVCFNIVSLFLISVPISLVTWYEVGSKNVSGLVKDKNSELEIKGAIAKPDIYYIVLDGYGRKDVLGDIYSFDNGEFIKKLEDRAFYVARESTANYPQTYLSVSSSLNYRYLDNLSASISKDSDDRGPLRELVKENDIYNALREIGYKFVAFPHTWTGTQDNLHADVFMQNKFNVTEFADSLIQSTPLRIFLNKNLFLDSYRNKLYFVFDNLGSLSKITAPTFTYVHLLAPHPPFVFDENGEAPETRARFVSFDGDHYFNHNPGIEDYRKQYISQLQFINKKILSSLDQILANSSTPPVIILQSDHGPGSELFWEDPDRTNMYERMSILNAYYLPEKGKEMLYPSITPVNSFRVVFNALFDADLELLEDRNYFARWSRPYDFIEVTEKTQKND